MRKHNMKNIKAFVIFMIFEALGIALLALIIYNRHNGYKWYTLPDKKIEVEYTANGINLESKGLVRSRSAAKAEEALNKMGNIAKEQAQYGVTIVPKSEITQVYNPNNIYSNDPSNYRTVAYYTRAKKTIVICDDENADWTVCHEMGHYLDENYWLGYRISDDKIWQTITEEEYPNTGWDLYYTRPSEFWGECFAAYYNDPCWLYEHCNKAYNVIYSVVEQYR